MDSAETWESVGVEVVIQDDLVSSVKVDRTFSYVGVFLHCSGTEVDHGAR